MNKTLKTIVIALSALAAIGGTAALVYFGAKSIKRLTTPETESVSSTSDSSQANSGGSSSTGSSAAVSSTGANVTDSPTLKGNKSELVFKCNESDTSYPTDSFMVAISGLAENAADSKKQLYIYCDDDALDLWVKLTVLRNGTYEKLTSPYIFKSGETVNVTPLKLPTLQDSYWYKLPLWVRYTAEEDPHWLVEVNIYNNALYQ
jgi:hypothetical protein